MRPTVPELLTGIADALSTDAITDLPARRQVQAAAAMLRRLTALVPQLHPWLWADADDIAATLGALAPELAPPLQATAGEAIGALHALDPRAATIDDLHAVHQTLLAVLDDVVATTDLMDPVLGPPLRDLLARVVRREHALGASIAGR